MIDKLIDGRRVRIKEGSGKTCVFTFFAEFDEGTVDDLLESIPCDTVVAIWIENWRDDLSPWKAPAFRGNEDFGDKAGDTLSFITDSLIPMMGCERNIIGGYSLAGLFSLWACYESDAFYACASVSPSVWFYKWDDFIGENSFRAKKLYLSLGDKESDVKNATLQKAGKRIELQYDVLSGEMGDNIILEWNQGGHFRDYLGRMSRAFKWTMDE